MLINVDKLITTTNQNNIKKSYINYSQAIIAIILFKF